MNIRVAIVDSDRGTREGLAALIRTTPGLRLGSVCHNGHSALCELPAAGPQVILLEANLRDCPGYVGIARLRAAVPGALVVVLSREPNPRAALAAFAAGAHGFVALSSPPVGIVEAVAEVMAGGAPLAPQAARALVERCHVEPLPVVEASELTRREEEVLAGFARGYRAKEVAAWLKVSIFTVQTHVRNIYSKLGARSAAHAVARYGPTARLASARPE
ncbi:MAG TPA: response regulator transcription factor [Verrucomicrobiota bacterium]|nr:hypothetical protein [Verrucomicrobiales bacterium]HRI16283.1 response regulator transcription factor [Verrucomicrobiota bacterium]